MTSDYIDPFLPHEKLHIVIDITAAKYPRIENFCGGGSIMDLMIIVGALRGRPTLSTNWRCSWHESRPEGGDIQTCECRTTPSEQQDPATKTRGELATLGSRG